ncbi:MAG: hypothetical protein KF681_06760 [Bdellovibrionaceae bacterium]|nr:hypothetical protein [Pseudobdellovibrionaceae bacterium]
MKLQTPLILALSLVCVTACKKKDVDYVAEAQDCLDKTDSSGALECMQKVEGIETESAYLIRCSANFIYQEFMDPVRLSNIAEQMKASNSSPLAAIGLLAFSKPVGNNPTAATARTNLSTATMDYCTKAKSKGMLLLSSMAQIATVASSALPDTEELINACDPNSPGYDANDCKDKAKEAICEASPAVIGEAALAAYQQSCLGSSQQNSSVCEQFAAITNGTTDPTTIGTNLQTQDGPCPP